MDNEVSGDELKKVKTHGVLYVHGAGLPEDDKTIVGDPLSEIANGLIDTFTNDESLRTCCRWVTKACESEGNLNELELGLFRRSKDAPEERVGTIRMRDVLWKPTMRKGSLTDYIPLLWLWALAFQSHATRIARLEELDRDEPDGWDKAGLKTLEEKSRDSRRRRDLWARILVATGGLASWLFIVWVVKALAAAINPAWVGRGQLLEQLGPIASGAICVTITASLVLSLLALEEYADKEAAKPHSYLQMCATIVATAWLGIFLVPLLLAVYYIERIVAVLAVLAAGAGAIVAAVRLSEWWERLGFLALVSLVLGFVVYLRPKTPTADWFYQRLRRDVHSTMANWLTTLLIIAGAPLIIAIILCLELLSVLPFVGEEIKKLATDIGEAAQWENLKDICMYLNDSGRAAVARCRIERAICELANQVDVVHILAHSLGTVVAYETLAQIGRGEGTLIKKGDPTYSKLKSLVTFGSPLNKIRTLANKTEQQQRGLTKLDFLRFDDAVILSAPSGFCWLNFYSFQDAASDILSLYSRDCDPVRPHEFSTASADDFLTAHGAYWTDRGFWKTTLSAMGLLPSSGDLARVGQLFGRDGDRRLLRRFREEGILTQGQLVAMLSDPDQGALLSKSAAGIREPQMILSMLKNSELPVRIPACAVNLLARPEWFREPDMVARTRLEWINYARGRRDPRLLLMRMIAGLLSSRRFSGRDDIWAITLGSTIYIRMAEQYDPHTIAGLTLLAHELKHVEQYEREGLIRFLFKYIVAYVTRRGYGKSLPFENEAYAFADQVCKHLTGEFSCNPGVSPCVEQAEPHTPNKEFVKAKPNDVLVHS